MTDDRRTLLHGIQNPGMTNKKNCTDKGQKLLIVTYLECKDYLFLDSDPATCAVATCVVILGSETV